MLNDLHVLRPQKIHAHNAGDMKGIPEICRQLLCIRQRDGGKGFRPGIFHHAHEDPAPVGVGEGGIGLPNAAGKTALRLFGLQTVIFPVLFQLAPVQHCHHPSTISRIIIKEKPVAKARVPI